MAEELGLEAERAALSLASEAPALRPCAASGLPGGLVRVSTPYVVLLPDLHARALFLAETLASPSPVEADRRLIDLVLGKRLTVVCLGDVINGEGPRAAARWRRAAASLGGPHGLKALLGADMDEEMGESLRALLLAMRLKEELGGGFHCLKGNHDNIGNLDADGDSPFRKYAMEGAMGAAWFKLRYGEAVLETLRRYERLLLLAVAGRSFCASHAEPAFPLCEAELLEYRQRPDVVRALIWTADGQARDDAVERCLAALLGERGKSGLWLSGHRPVSDVFARRAGGRLVQIHNPDRNQIAWVDNGAGDDAPEIAFYEVAAGGGLRLMERLKASAS